MIGQFLLAALGAQATVAADPPAPGVKICPDGSRVLINDECPPVIQHRYILSHQSRHEIVSTEWWCGDDRQPSFAQLSIRQRPDARQRADAKLGTHELRVLKFTNAGRPAPPSKVAELQSKLAAVDMIGGLSGRCIYRPSGGIQAVLEMNGYEVGKTGSKRIDVVLP